MPMILSVLRKTYKEDTRASPAEMVLGKPIPIPFEVYINVAVRVSLLDENVFQMAHEICFTDNFVSSS